MDAEMRVALDAVRQDIDGLRAEMRTGFRAVDEKLTVVDERFDGVDRRFDEALRQFGVIAEDLRAQLRLVAEGVVMNAEAITRMRAAFDDSRDR